ncbi:MAG: hypothetical protein M3Y65_25030 [Pseudomonadota bacterium]|nr:hypothetical protein [Pseudomonadota bacterium]
MFVPKNAAPANHVDLIKAAARRIQALATSNPLKGFAAPADYERACYNSKPTAVMYDLLHGDELTGFQALPLSRPEERAAWSIINASGVDYHLRMSKAGHVELRQQLAREAQHVVHFLKEQRHLALEGAAA